MEKVKRAVGRSYGQFCGVARALDIVGDRWNLLIVRELLAGPMRFNELVGSLRGIATNLLTERLRTLETVGIVERRLGSVGVVYTLTPWGAGLREPVEALARWGAPLMMRGRDGDSFRPRWLAVALPALLRGVTADPPIELGFEIEGSLTVLLVDEGGPRVAQGDREPGTILTAAPEIVLGLAAGALTIDQALAASSVQGDLEILHKVFPLTRATATTVLDSR